MSDLPPDDERHGTHAGAMAHQRLGIPKCEPCLIAQREYIREYRRKRGPEKDRNWAATRGRALQLLADRHPVEFRFLVDSVRQEAK